MATLLQVGSTDNFKTWRTVTNSLVDMVNFNKVGSPTLMQTLRDLTNYLESAGVFNGCGITDNLDGTVDVDAGEALLRANSVVGSELFSVALSASSAVSLTNNDLNYIYADYNAGSPTISVDTDSATITGHDIVLIAIVSREGTDLTILEATSEMSDQHNKLSDMLVETEGFKHVLGGGLISEVGTKQLALTVGSFYRGLNKFTHPAYDTSAADTFEYYYRDGGSGWTEVTSQTVVDVLNYDNNSGVLQAITANKYSCQWVYLKLGMNGTELYAFYGQGEYNTISEARTEDAPAALPNHLDELGVLVGRLIFKQNNPIINVVESAFGVSFKAGSAQAHNNLSGMQGGAPDEYYHLDNAEHGVVLGHLTDTGNPHTTTWAQVGADEAGTAVAMAIALG